MYPTQRFINKPLQYDCYAFERKLNVLLLCNTAGKFLSIYHKEYKLKNAPQTYPHAKIMDAFY